MSAFAHIAVGITLVASCAAPKPVPQTHFMYRRDADQASSCNEADQILEIP